MGKFTDVEKDIYSVFSSQAWVNENIKTYPSNFLAINPGNEYIRVSVIPSGNGINIQSVSGILIIDIYTSAGSGIRRASLIADILEGYFAGKQKQTAQNAVTQFTSGTLNHTGVDRDNPSLYRSSYTIPFNYYGVL